MGETSVSAHPVCHCVTKRKPVEVTVDVSYGGTVTVVDRYWLCDFCHLLIEDTP